MKICENCGCEHGGSFASGRFCSKSCACSFVSKQNREEKNRKRALTLKKYYENHPEAKLELSKRNKGVQRRKNSELTDDERSTEKFCIWCGIGIAKKSVKANKGIRFCSNKCCAVYKRHEFFGNSANGKLLKLNKARRLRIYLIEIRGHKCEICNNTEWIGQPIRLETHHKDGNSENYAFDNILLLCPNCHSQTPTYGSKNKGNGRDYRQQWRQRNKEKQAGVAEKLCISLPS